MSWLKFSEIDQIRKTGKNLIDILVLAGSDGRNLVIGTAFLLSWLVRKSFRKFSTALRSQSLSGPGSLVLFVSRNFLILSAVDRAALIFVERTVSMMKIAVVGLALFINISSELSVTLTKRSFTVTRGVLANEVLIPCISIDHGVHFVRLPPRADIGTEVIHCASNAFLMPFTSRIDLVNRISVSRHNIVWSVNHTVTAIWTVTSPFTILRIMKVQNHFFHRFVLSELHF